MPFFKIYFHLLAIRSLHTAPAVGTPLEEDPSLIRQGKLNAMRNEIYCHGTLLAAVQTSHLFVDCKHFVDMPLKTDAGEQSLIYLFTNTQLIKLPAN